MDKTLKPQKGICFKPRESERMIASGFINQGDSEIGQYDGDKVIITRSEHNGNKFHDVFIHAGKLYQSQNKEYKLDGSLLDKKLFIYFNKAQSGVDYMGLSLAGDIENKPVEQNNFEQTDDNETDDNETDDGVEDEIPF